MPSFRRRVDLEVARNLRAFFELKVGMTRGPVADDARPLAETRELKRRLARTEERLRRKGRRLARLENGFARVAGPSPQGGSNSRKRGASTLLVSFCNVRDENKPVLAAVDLREADPAVHWIKVKEDTSVRGATGLCFWNDLVCVVQQGWPGVPQGFVLLDPSSGFELVHEGSLPLQPAGVHSVCARGEELFVVASRRDGVYRAALDERSGEWVCSLYWTFPGSSGRADENHINAIECVDGELYVSGFGRKGSDKWTSATRGFIYNVDREEYVMEDVHHPHSLLWDSGVVWTCESAGSALLSGAGVRVKLPTGYIRGLAINEERFFLASSKRRKFSESTEAVNPGAVAQYEGRCCVYALDGGFEEPEVLVDFSEVRNEIYELALI